jgi:mono/diheme cytochrome c family protein
MRHLLTAAIALGLAAGLHAGQRSPAPAPAAAVTAVSGQSWLHKKGLEYRDTNMGRAGAAGRYGPNPTDLAKPQPPVSLTAGTRMTLTAADIYRFNCQACHRAEGTGAPPEIKSILPAVQGTTLQQMRGAAVTKADLFARIQKGGLKMPPRAHLTTADMEALYTYLTSLAGGGPAHAEGNVTVDRVGENVVKGTCHICHDAVGPRPSDAAMLAGAIPSLASLMTDRSIVEFVNKAERGAVAVMGTPPVPHRGRMPVFYYLTDHELATAYLYLKRYPPAP